MGRSALPRQVALLGVVVVACLIVLLGGREVVQRAGQTPAPGVELTRPPAAAAGGVAPSEAPAAATDVPASPGAPASDDPAGPTGTDPASPAPSGDPVILAAGDIADCEIQDDEATAALLDRLPGTILTLGDNVYPSATKRTFEECFAPSWGRHLERIRPGPGNHDWESGGLDAYLEYFGEAAVNEDGDPWYTFEVGAWRIIALESDCRRVGGCDAESRQGRWLAQALQASTSRCTLAFFHHPRFSSGQHGDNENTGYFWEALYEADADVVLNGHDHDYERFAPQDPSGAEDRERGIRQFIVGTGGRSLRSFERVAPNSELRAAIAYGVLELQLRPDSYDWTFHATDGAFEDRGTAFCH